MISRQNDPSSTDAWVALPLRRTNEPSQASRSTALGFDRLATAIVPARGSHSTSRTDQKNSRIRRMLRYRCPQSSWTYRSGLNWTPAATSDSPAATCWPPNASNGTKPSPRCFQSASVTSAGVSATAKASACRGRRATARARNGAASTTAFAGLIPIAKPTSRPAIAPSLPRWSSIARQRKAAAASRKTIDG